MKNNEKHPKVSVCIPTYNEANLLKIAIESVLKQNFNDYELIIVNDASTDNTEEIVKSFNHPKIRYYKNEKNLGLVGNWNKCLEYVKGDYIKFLFHDDYLRKDSLEKIINVFRKYEKVGLVFNANQNINQDNDYIGVYRPYKEDRYFKGKELVVEAVIKGIGGPSSVAVKKEAFGRLGLFTDELKFGCDEEMWVRVLMHYDGYYINDRLSFIRIHERSETSRLQKEGVTALENFKNLEYYFRDKNIKKLFTKDQIEKCYIRVLKKAIGITLHNLKSLHLIKFLKNIKMIFSYCSLHIILLTLKDTLVIRFRKELAMD